MERNKTACAVVGATGRMGRRICRLLAEAEGLSIAGATESVHSKHLGSSLKDAAGIGGSEVILVDSLQKIESPFDVVIDFTFPEVSMETIRFAGREGKRAVIGTTGFAEAEMKELEDLSTGFPCVWAPNMSLGVNTLFKIVGDVARILQDGFDAEVVEIHHRHKKDAPSGTAVHIARILAEAYGRDLSRVGVYERRGIIGERSKEEIGIQTLRGGDVVGEHTVMFAGAGERLELIHRAQSRDCFAQGALFAARWVADKPSGLYDMQDVLGLRE